MNTTFTFQDVFSKKFLEAFSPERIDFTDIGITLTVCLIIAFGIYLVYRRSFSGAVYDNGYALSLVLACLITALIIKAITFNIVLSLGMVGALSIIRFRTAIKEPTDIVFMFWAIAVGIICGAGIYFLAIAGSVLIAVILLILSGRAPHLSAFLLVVHGTTELDDAVVAAALSKDLLKYSLKSKIMDEERIELSYKVRLRKDGADVVKKIKGLEHVAGVSLISYTPTAVP
jgi:hypothetical protein